MCGIAGIIKNTKLEELDIYKGYLLWINMAERGRTSHGCSIIDRDENVINYYKCGSGPKEPNKSSENDEALQMLGKCTSSLDNPTVMFVHDRAASTLAGGTNNKENTQPLVVKFGDGQYITLMHNGTIHNMEEIYNKETGKKANSSYSDSYLAALLFQEEKYDWLSTYTGAASLVWYNTNTRKLYMWRGESPEYEGEPKLKEERPLYYVKKDDRIEFASTVDALFNTDLNPNLDSIVSLKANTLFSIDYETLSLEEVMVLDRSKAAQRETNYYNPYSSYPSKYSSSKSYGYGYGNSYDYGYGNRNSYPSLPKKKEVTYPPKEVKVKDEDLEGLFKAIPFCANYFDNYDTILSRLPDEAAFITEFKDKLKSNKINLFAGLYYNNGGLMHSQIPVYSSIKDYESNPPKVDGYLNIPYLISSFTGNVLSFRFKEDLHEEYFWKGLLCKDKEHFLKLEYLTHKSTTITVLTSLELSTYLKTPTFYGVIFNNGKVNFTVSGKIFYKGQSMDSYPKDFLEVFPYTNINYKHENKSFTNNYYNYCLAKFIKGLLNGLFSMRNYEELVSPINLAGLDNLLYGKYSLLNLRTKIGEKLEENINSSCTVKDAMKGMNLIMMGNEDSKK